MSTRLSLNPFRLYCRHCSVQAGAKKSVAFLGSPGVAADALEKLLDEARKETSRFEITTVVSRPNRPVGRKNRKIPSPTPVSAFALDNGFIPEETLLTPESARDEAFLARMEQHKPDLCVTAAYGNFLPSRFLRIPPHGTLNIHPSLLPKYRGAAPVNRALEDGVTQTGVSIVYTVREMDAGPIVASRTLDVDPDIQAPELLKELFSIGTELLLDVLPSVFDNSAVLTPQDPSEATHAAKMDSSESMLIFQNTAEVLHNRVRAFAPWPGTLAVFKVLNTLDASFKDLHLRILKTRLPDEDLGRLDFRQGVCFLGNRRLFLQCGEGTVLEVLSVQRQGGKALQIRDFKNGLSRRQVLTLAC